MGYEYLRLWRRLKDLDKVESTSENPEDSFDHHGLLLQRNYLQAKGQPLNVNQIGKVLIVGNVEDVGDGNSMKSVDLY